MEILIGVAVSGVLEVYKRLAAKWGIETSKKVIFSVLFVASLVYTLLTHFGVITKEMIESFTTVFMSAVGTYEMILKPILKALGISKE